jgi:hypothetical protein
VHSRQDKLREQPKLGGWTTPPMAKSQSKTQRKMTGLVKLKFESSAAVRKDRTQRKRMIS